MVHWLVSKADQQPWRYLPAAGAARVALPAEGGAELVLEPTRPM